VAGIKPHYLIGNLPQPQIFKCHDDVHGGLFGPCHEPPGVGQRATILESKSIGHGMAPKVFWGMIKCQGQVGKESDRP